MGDAVAVGEWESKGESFAGAVIDAIPRLSFALSEVLSKGSTVGLDKGFEALEKGGTALGVLLEVGVIETRLSSDVAKANGNPHDTAVAYFNADLDLLAAGFKIAVGQLAAESAVIFAEGIAVGLGVTLAPISVPLLAAGLLGGIGMKLAVDYLWETGVRPAIVHNLLGPAFEFPKGHAEGTATDGPLAGATIFVDANFNGRFDSGETSVTTDAIGHFSIEAGLGPLIVTGGKDIISGEHFTGYMTLRDNQTVISPLTTLINMLEDQGQVLPRDKVHTAFSLNPAIDLENLDPVARISDVAGAAKVFGAGAEVLVTVDELAALFAGSGRQQKIIHDAYDVIAQFVDIVGGSIDDLGPGQRIGLSEVGSSDGSSGIGIRTFIAILAQVEGVRLTEDQIDAAAAPIAALNAQIDLDLGYAPPVVVTGGDQTIPPPPTALAGAALISAVGAIEKQAQKALNAAHFKADSAPTISSNEGSSLATVSVREGTSAVGKVVATDRDDFALNYSIVGGADSRKFLIDPFGNLKFATVPNFETPGSARHENHYKVTVQASDGTLSDTQALTITVTDVSEPIIQGSKKKDHLKGGPSDDILDGGGSKDWLTGDAGGDTFRFSSKLGAKNIDHLTDFAPGADSIELDQSVFSKLSHGDLLSVLAVDEFSLGKSAHDRRDHILYVQEEGALFYDPDGTGSKAPIKFAVLDHHPDLTWHDLLIV